MESSTDAAKHTRRSFLDLVLGIGATGWLASVLYPVIRYLTPLPSAGPSGPVKLSADQVKTLDKERFVIVPVQGKRILVFQDPAQNVRALDARCTHEGCTVQFVPGESVIWCACHNGRFDLDGRVLSGPPPRPLSQYLARQDAEGGVTVTPQTA
ncbi:MAG: Rieske (2Fe-2S) protein [Deltaproteobacteria bacterium]|nr:Rieske (2Fe-2S) protein [Deltaproteobacteria bacterium]